MNNTTDEPKWATNIQIMEYALSVVLMQYGTYDTATDKLTIASADFHIDKLASQLIKVMQEKGCDIYHESAPPSPNGQSLQPPKSR